MAERIEADIRSRIKSGVYQPGTLLPGRRALADEYESGPIAISQAVKNLIGEGILRSENGRGTFVAETVPHQPPDLQPLGGALIAGKTLGIVGFVDEAECAANPHIVTPEMQIISAAGKLFGDAGGLSVFMNRWSAPDKWVGSGVALERMLSRQVDAIMFVDIYDNEEGLAELRSLPGIDTLPIVYVSSVDNYIPCAHVYYDNRDAGYKAADSLCKAGYRKVVFYAPFTERWVDERIDGARMACLHRREPVQFEVFPVSRSANYTESVRLREADKYVEFPLLRGQSGGIVAGNDYLALCMVNAGKLQGREAGVDFGVVGFDDEPMSVIRGLTTVQRPLAEMGECAAQVAADRVAGRGSNSVHSLRSSVVIRNSHLRIP